MIPCVHGFLMYHAAVGQRVLPDHFNFKSDSDEARNFFMVKEENSEIETCVRLVELFSRPGDWILDIRVPKGIKL